MRKWAILSMCLILLANLVLVASPLTQPAAAQGKTFKWKVQSAWPPTSIVVGPARESRWAT